MSCLCIKQKVPKQKQNFKNFYDFFTLLCSTKNCVGSFFRFISFSRSRRRYSCICVNFFSWNIFKHIFIRFGSFVARSHNIRSFHIVFSWAYLVVCHFVEFVVRLCFSFGFYYLGHWGKIWNIFKCNISFILAKKWPYKQIIEIY